MLGDQIRGEVRQYLYRSVQITDVFLELPYSSFREIETQLAEAAGKRTDNHTVYMVKQPGWGPEGKRENIIYIAVDDPTVSFGRGILEEPW